MRPHHCLERVPWLPSCVCLLPTLILGLCFSAAPGSMSPALGGLLPKYQQQHEDLWPCKPRGSGGKAPGLGKDGSSSLSLPLSADPAAERGEHPREHVSRLLGLLQACARDGPWAGEAGGAACEGTGMFPDVLLALRAVPSGFPASTLPQKMDS